MLMPKTEMSSRGSIKYVCILNQELLIGQHVRGDMTGSPYSSPMGTTHTVIYIHKVGGRSFQI